MTVRCDNNSGLDGKPFLTGVGGYVPPQIPDCEAPSNPEARWDDESYHRSIEDRFPPLIGHWARPQPGFLFHEACWKLLRRLMYPAAVPVERLYDICLSCPANVAGWLDWGHSYGGLMDRLPLNGYSFEDIYIVGFVKRYLGDKYSPLLFAMCDPSTVPELEQALANTRKRRESLPDGADSISHSISPLFRGPEDCFRRLPQEVLEYIQTLLSSPAVVNARMASRSFASLRTDQSFWASRFGDYHERGYCVEAQYLLYEDVTERRNRDWKALYRQTAVTSTSSNELKNRKRIVDCLWDLVDVLLEKPQINKTTFIRNLQISPEEPRDTSWRSIGGDSVPRPQPHHFPSGIRCKRVYEQVLSLPPSPIKTIGVTFRRFSSLYYISGLRFVFKDANEALMGYIIPGKERYLALDGESDFHLTGFVTAVGARGIMALRAVSEKGNVSDWIGSAERLPQSLRLCMKSRIETLKGFFDVRPPYDHRQNTNSYVNDLYDIGYKTNYPRRPNKDDHSLPRISPTYFSPLVPNPADALAEPPRLLLPSPPRLPKRIPSPRARHVRRSRWCPAGPSRAGLRDRVEVCDCRDQLFL